MLTAKKENTAVHYKCCSSYKTSTNSSLARSIKGSSGLVVTEKITSVGYSPRSPKSTQAYVPHPKWSQDNGQQKAQELGKFFHEFMQEYDRKFDLKAVETQWVLQQKPAEIAVLSEIRDGGGQIGYWVAKPLVALMTSLLAYPLLIVLFFFGILVITASSGSVILLVFSCSGC